MKGIGAALGSWQLVGERGTARGGRLFVARPLGPAGFDRPVDLLVVDGLGHGAFEAWAARTRALPRVVDPGVIALVDVGRADDGTCFVVSEHVPGALATELVRRTGPLAADLVGLIGRDVTAALSALIEAGHDPVALAPGDVMVGADGRARITGCWAGGVPAAADAAAVRRLDPLVAIGGLLWELATGGPPGATELAAGTPPRLATALREAVAEGRPDRPADLAAFGASLARAVDPARPSTEALARLVARVANEARLADIDAERPAEEWADDDDADDAFAAPLPRSLREQAPARPAPPPASLSRRESAPAPYPPGAPYAPGAPFAQPALPTAPAPVRPEAPLYVDDNVQFTVYRPRAVAPGRWYPMLAFAHLAERRDDAAPGDPDPIEEVRRQAEQVLGAAVGEQAAITADARQAVPRDGELTFVPDIPGVTFNPPRRSFLWEEPVHREEFRLRAAPELNGQVARGRLTVFLGHLVLAEVSVAIRVEARPPAQAAPPLEADRARPYRRIFASYSHRDAAIVTEVEKYARALGDEYVRDWVHLRTGEVWSDRLRQLITEADVFQLFWSHNSMRSTFVRQEWEYALSLARPSFVRPTYWEDPMPAAADEGLPPDALLRLHFQRIDPVIVAATAGAGAVAGSPARARQARRVEPKAKQAEAPRLAAAGPAMASSAVAPPPTEIPAPPGITRSGTPMPPEPDPPGRASQVVLDQARFAGARPPTDQIEASANVAPRGRPAPGRGVTIALFAILLIAIAFAIYLLVR